MCITDFYLTQANLAYMLLSHQSQGTGVHGHRPRTFLISYFFNLDGFLWGQPFPFHDASYNVFLLRISHLSFSVEMERNRTGPIVKLTSHVTRSPLYLHFCWQELQFPDYKRWPGVTSAQGAKSCCTSWMRCRLEQQTGGGWPRQVSTSPQPESLRISQVLLRKLSKFKDSAMALLSSEKYHVVLDCRVVVCQLKL